MCIRNDGYILNIHFSSVNSRLAKRRLFCGFEKFYARRLLCSLCILWKLHTKELQVKIMPIV